ncbi:MAG: 5-(carboxyamino)imidazole ribonucleotide mutase [Bacillota bacterium]|jgi:5-(carboxyamino)imidazole ribonucleotide mutase|nr:5-(carboxyamino)imidazole ribonucleotide mutase [Bacillota bacterium]HHU43550.1 5-(carboxyamino)imidazole ribonucleotide mutase [Clostridiales bacterium]
MPKAAIVMGSKSDFPVVKKAIEIFKEFGINTEVRVLSAHRTPFEACQFALDAEKNGIDVIIGCAGKAAHLAGVLAANCVLPIIGLPIKSSTMDGLDSLLSTVQMPSGVPVATVAINGAENAALLAIQIMALKYPYLKDKLRAHKDNMRQKILSDDKALREELFKE